MSQVYGYLVIIKKDGTTDGSRYAVTNNSITIGRSFGCDIRFSRPNVALEQCLIQFLPDGEVYVKNLDCASLPVTIDGKLIENKRLLPGQTFAIDTRQFRFEQTEEQRLFQISHLRRHSYTSTQSNTTDVLNENMKRRHTEAHVPLSLTNENNPKPSENENESFEVVSSPSFIEENVPESIESTKPTKKSQMKNVNGNLSLKKIKESQNKLNRRKTLLDNAETSNLENDILDKPLMKRKTRSNSIQPINKQPTLRRSTRSRSISGTTPTEFTPITPKLNKTLNLKTRTPRKLNELQSIILKNLAKNDTTDIENDSDLSPNISTTVLNNTSIKSISSEDNNASLYYSTPFRKSMIEDSMNTSSSVTPNTSVKSLRSRNVKSTYKETSNNSTVKTGIDQYTKNPDANSQNSEKDINVNDISQECIKTLANNISTRYRKSINENIENSIIEDLNSTKNNMFTVSMRSEKLQNENDSEIIQDTNYKFNDDTSKRSAKLSSQKENKIEETKLENDNRTQTSYQNTSDSQNPINNSQVSANTSQINDLEISSSIHARKSIQIDTGNKTIIENGDISENENRFDLKSTKNDSNLVVMNTSKVSTRSVKSTPQKTNKTLIEDDLEETRFGNDSKLSIHDNTTLNTPKHNVSNISTRSRISTRFETENNSEIIEIDENTRTEDLNSTKNDSNLVVMNTSKVSTRSVKSTPQKTNKTQVIEDDLEETRFSNDSKLSIHDNTTLNTPKHNASNISTRSRKSTRFEIENNSEIIEIDENIATEDELNLNSTKNDSNLVVMNTSKVSTRSVKNTPQKTNKTQVIEDDLEDTRFSNDSKLSIHDNTTLNTPKHNASNISTRSRKSARFEIENNSEIIEIDENIATEDELNLNSTKNDSNLVVMNTSKVSTRSVKNTPQKTNKTQVIEDDLEDTRFSNDSKLSIHDNTTLNTPKHNASNISTRSRKSARFEIENNSEIIEINENTRTEDLNSTKNDSNLVVMNTSKVSTRSVKNTPQKTNKTQVIEDDLEDTRFSNDSKLSIHDNTTLNTPKHNASNISTRSRKSTRFEIENNSEIIEIDENIATEDELNLNSTKNDSNLVVMNTSKISTRSVKNTPQKTNKTQVIEDDLEETIFGNDSKLSLHENTTLNSPKHNASNISTRSRKSTRFEIENNSEIIEIDENTGTEDLNSTKNDSNLVVMNTSKVSTRSVKSTPQKTNKTLIEDDLEETRFGNDSKLSIHDNTTLNTPKHNVSNISTRSRISTRFETENNSEIIEIDENTGTEDLNSTKNDSNLVVMNTSKVSTRSVKNTPQKTNKTQVIEDDLEETRFSNDSKLSIHDNTTLNTPKHNAPNISTRSRKSTRFEIENNSEIIEIDENIATEDELNLNSTKNDSNLVVMNTSKVSTRSVKNTPQKTNKTQVIEDDLEETIFGNDSKLSLHENTTLNSPKHNVSNISTRSRISTRFETENNSEIIEIDENTGTEDLNSTKNDSNLVVMNTSKVSTRSVKNTPQKTNKTQVIEDDLEETRFSNDSKLSIHDNTTLNTPKHNVTNISTRSRISTRFETENNSEIIEIDENTGTEDLNSTKNDSNLVVMNTSKVSTRSVKNTPQKTNKTQVIEDDLEETRFSNDSKLSIHDNTTLNTPKHNAPNISTRSRKSTRFEIENNSEIIEIDENIATEDELNLNSTKNDSNLVVMNTSKVSTRSVKSTPQKTNKTQVIEDDLEETIFGNDSKLSSHDNTTTLNTPKHNVTNISTRSRKTTRFNTENSSKIIEDVFLGVQNKSIVEVPNTSSMSLRSRKDFSRVENQSQIFEELSLVEESNPEFNLTNLSTRSRKSIRFDTDNISERIEVDDFEENSDKETTKNVSDLGNVSNSSHQTGNKSEITDNISKKSIQDEIMNITGEENLSKIDSSTVSNTTSRSKRFNVSEKSNISNKLDSTHFKFDNQQATTSTKSLQNMCGIVDIENLSREETELNHSTLKSRHSSSGRFEVEQLETTSTAVSKLKPSKSIIDTINIDTDNSIFENDCSTSKISLRSSRKLNTNAPIEFSTPTRKLRRSTIDSVTKSKIFGNDNIENNLNITPVTENTRILRSRRISTDTPTKNILTKSRQKLFRNLSQEESSHFSPSCSNLEPIIDEEKSLSVTSTSEIVVTPKSSYVIDVVPETPFLQNMSKNFTSTPKPIENVNNKSPKLQIEEPIKEEDVSSDDRETPKTHAKIEIQELKQQHSTAKKQRKSIKLSNNTSVVTQMVKQLFKNTDLETDENCATTESNRKRRRINYSYIDVEITKKKCSNKNNKSLNDLNNVSNLKILRSTSSKLQPSQLYSTSDDQLTTEPTNDLITNIRDVQNSPKNDLSNVRDIKQLMATSKVQNSPKNDLTNVRGVKQLMATPKVQNSPKNDLTNVRGVKQLMTTPKVKKSPKNDLTNVRGVKQLMTTPKVQKSPKNDLTNIRGVKQLMATPKIQNSPKNDLTNVRGVKQLLATPKIQKSPKNDLTNIKGVKQLMITPKVQNVPKNDLTNIEGVKELIKTPRTDRQSKVDLLNSNILQNDGDGLMALDVQVDSIESQEARSPIVMRTSFDELVNTYPIRTYQKSPKKRLYNSPSKSDSVTAIEIPEVSRKRHIKEKNTTTTVEINDEQCSSKTNVFNNTSEKENPTQLRRILRNRNISADDVLKPKENVMIPPATIDLYVNMHLNVNETQERTRSTRSKIVISENTTPKIQISKQRVLRNRNEDDVLKLKETLLDSKKTDKDTQIKTKTRDRTTNTKTEEKIDKQIQVKTMTRNRGSNTEKVVEDEQEKISGRITRRNIVSSPRGPRSNRARNVKEDESLIKKTLKYKIDEVFDVEKSSTSSKETENVKNQGLKKSARVSSGRDNKDIIDLDVEVLNTPVKIILNESEKKVCDDKENGIKEKIPVKRGRPKKDVSQQSTPVPTITKNNTPSSDNIIKTLVGKKLSEINDDRNRNNKLTECFKQSLSPVQIIIDECDKKVVDDIMNEEEEKVTKRTRGGRSTKNTELVVEKDMYTKRTRSRSAKDNTEVEEIAKERSISPHEISVKRTRGRATKKITDVDMPAKKRYLSPVVVANTWEKNEETSAKRTRGRTTKKDTEVEEKRTTERSPSVEETSAKRTRGRTTKKDTEVEEKRTERSPSVEETSAKRTRGRTTKKDIEVEVNTKKERSPSVEETSVKRIRGRTTKKYTEVEEKRTTERFPSVEETSTNRTRGRNTKKDIEVEEKRTTERSPSVEETSAKRTRGRTTKKDTAVEEKTTYERSPSVEETSAKRTRGRTTKKDTAVEEKTTKERSPNVEEISVKTTRGRTTIKDTEVEEKTTKERSPSVEETSVKRTRGRTTKKDTEVEEKTTKERSPSVEETSVKTTRGRTTKKDTEVEEKTTKERSPSVEETSVKRTRGRTTKKDTEVEEKTTKERSPSVEKTSVKRTRGASKKNTEVDRSEESNPKRKRGKLTIKDDGIMNSLSPLNVVTENIIDKEDGGENHKRLRVRFAKDEIENVRTTPIIKELKQKQQEVSLPKTRSRRAK